MPRHLQLAEARGFVSLHSGVVPILRWGGVEAVLGAGLPLGNSSNTHMLPCRVFPFLLRFLNHRFSLFTNSPLVSRWSRWASLYTLLLLLGGGVVVGVGGEAGVILLVLSLVLALRHRVRIFER